MRLLEKAARILEPEANLGHDENHDLKSEGGVSKALSKAGSQLEFEEKHERAAQNNQKKRSPQSLIEYSKFRSKKSTKLLVKTMKKVIEQEIPKNIHLGMSQLLPNLTTPQLAQSRVTQVASSSHMVDKVQNQPIDTEKSYSFKMIEESPSEVGEHQSHFEGENYQNRGTQK